MEEETKIGLSLARVFFRWVHPIKPTGVSDGIALAVQAIPPIPTHFSIAWSVCLSHASVWLSNTCTMLKPFDELRCHLVGTIVRSNDAVCLRGLLDFQEKGRFWGRTPSQNMQLQIAAK